MIWRVCFLSSILCYDVPLTKHVRTCINDHTYFILVVTGLILSRGTGLSTILDFLKSNLSNSFPSTIIPFEEAGRYFDAAPWKYAFGTLFASLVDFLGSLNLLLWNLHSFITSSLVWTLLKFINRSCGCDYVITLSVFVHNFQVCIL